MGTILPCPTPSSFGADIVESLRDLLGHDVLLLHWPIRSKGDKRKWGHLSAVADMSKPEYLAKLRLGNIGVALGQTSGGLCSIDIDQDDGVERFLAVNPTLRESCITKGNRGANIWIRIVGPYPNTKPLKIGGSVEEASKKDALKYGEWRSTGVQTIIYGIHPSGVQYQFLSLRPPVEMEFEKIRFPENVYPMLSIPKSLHRDDIRDVSVVSVVSVKGVSVLSVKAEDDWIKEVIPQCIPTKERDNHNNNLFRLARHVWTMQKRRRTHFTELEVRSIVKYWFELTPAPFKRNCFEDYIAEFEEILEKVRCPIGDGRYDRAVKVARTAAPPRWMDKLPTDDHRRLLVLCRELQKQHGAEPFYLSCRMAEAFSTVHTATKRWHIGSIDSSRRDF